MIIRRYRKLPENVIVELESNTYYILLSMLAKTLRTGANAKDSTLKVKTT